MNKDSKYIMGSGFILVLVVYLLLYTPLYSAIFKIRPIVVVQNKLFVTKPATSTSESSSLLAQSGGRLFLRDPFNVGFSYEKAAASSVEVEKKVQKKESFVLQGIFVLPDGKTLAIIDDKMLSKGQSIYGWTVSDIFSDRVVLSLRGKTKVLKVKLGVE